MEDMEGNKEGVKKSKQNENGAVGVDALKEEVDKSMDKQDSNK